MNNARDQHEYRHNWGKIGSTYLLSENGDLSFLLFFSKQCLVENIQGKLMPISHSNEHIERNSHRYTFQDSMQSLQRKPLTVMISSYYQANVSLNQMSDSEEPARPSPFSYDLCLM